MDLGKGSLLKKASLKAKSLWMDSFFLSRKKGGRKKASTKGTLLLGGGTRLARKQRKASLKGFIGFLYQKGNHYQKVGVRRRVKNANNTSIHSAQSSLKEKRNVIRRVKPGEQRKKGPDPSLSPAGGAVKNICKGGGDRAQRTFIGVLG